MATKTKVQKAAEILLKQPDISGADLARAVKSDPSSGWALKKAVEKRMAKDNKKSGGKKPLLPPKEFAALEPASVRERSVDGTNIKVTVTAAGDDIVIRIPKKVLGNLLLSNLWQ